MTAMPVFGPVPLDVERNAPVRPARSRTRAVLADVPRPSSVQLTVAIDTIARTGWVEAFTEMLPGRRPEGEGGRVRTLGVEAVLVALLCLTVMERPLLVRDAWRLLASGLDANTRRRLGYGDAVITERMVSDLYNRIAACVDPSAHSRANAWLFDPDAVRANQGLGDDIELDDRDVAVFADWVLDGKRDRLAWMVRQGLRATHPAEVTHAGDFAVDASFIESWENPKTSRRRTTWTDANGVTHRRPAKPHLWCDPDARWWPKKAAKAGRLGGRGGDSGLGYAITAVVRVEPDTGPDGTRIDTPHLIEHLTVIGAQGSMWREGVRAIEEMATHHEAEDAEAGREHRQRGDILADREYTRVSAWQRAMHVQGFTPHFGLAVEQRTEDLAQVRTLPNGAIVIDGIAYSPGMPEHLRVSPKPIVFATRTQRAERAHFYAMREPYRLKSPRNARNDNGGLKLWCPASNVAGHAVACDNKPASLPGRIDRLRIGTALPVISTRPMPAVCAQSTTTATFDQLPFWQPHIPGTREHQWSVNRRNAVEGAFGRIKDEATQTLRRGEFRVFGIAKVTLAVLLNAMAANIKELQRWHDRAAGAVVLDDTREVRRRIPRRVTRARARDAQRRAESAARRAAAAATRLEVAAEPPAEHPART